MRAGIAKALLAFSCIGAAQQVVPTTARVEGQVISMIGEPLSAASVQLQGARAGQSGFTAQTDLSGNFAIDNITPGLYTVSASRTGFTTNPSALSLTLTAGQVRTGVAIQLSPLAGISGKVTDADALPMEKVKLTLYHRVFRYARWELEFSKDATTGPDGTFQLDAVPAGRYYLSAEDVSPPKESKPESKPEASAESYVTTYYPSALEPTAALPVEVGAGQPLHLEVRMRKERAYHIRGKAINTVTGDPAKDFVVRIAPAEYDPSVGLIPAKAGLVKKEDGSFEFDRLMPGRYVISTENTRVHVVGNSAQPEVPLVARETVNLSDVDVDDFALKLAPPADITGTIVTEGADPQPTLHLEITLMSLDGPRGDNIQLVPNKPDGSFLIPAVPPGTYEVNVNKVATGSYVKSMRFGGQDLVNGVFDNTSGSGGNIEIVLSTDVAEINGAVQNDSVDETPRMQVTLWGPGIIRNAESGAKGAFRFRDLPPGNYNVVAWEHVDPSLLVIPDFLVRFENQATSVTLAPKDHNTVQIQFVKRESVEAEAAKFR